MLKTMLTAVAVLVSQVPTPSTRPSASLRVNGVLQCPAGTQQLAESDAVLCARTTGGQRVFHGPYVAFWPNGVRQSEGQYVDGFRSGRWAFHDANGVPTGETWFKAGSYDGLRIELNPDGSKRLEEQWVAGKRQGLQKQWSAAGVLTITEYRDDRPVTR
jgi:antitoxin component YwqK of YwqJK toxin-antitoxin module